MKSALTLLALLGSALAEDLTPVVGDIGTLKICTDANECENPTCLGQRNADEGDDASENIPSATQKCLDVCGHSGYTVTQLNNTVAEDGVTVVRNIKLAPLEMSCLLGCQCPEATGMYEVVARDDDAAAQEPEVYTMSFQDRFGKTDKGYVTGDLTVTYTEGLVHQVSFMVDYVAWETDEDGMEKGEDEQCTLKYAIDTGKIGGIDSGAMVQPLVEYHSGEDLGQISRWEPLTTAEHGCTDATLEVNSDGWCQYQCAQGYTVNMINSSIVMIPKVTFINLQCVCEVGYGVQNGGGDEELRKTFGSASVSFDHASINMCSSTFDSPLIEVLASDSNSFPMHGAVFTMDFPNFVDESKTCTYAYKVIVGNVMGKKPAGETHENAKGKVAFAMILSVVLLFAFLAPGCMPTKGRNYDVVP
jgi:hypothetical protein